jgi:hypothetical protein
MKAIRFVSTIKICLLGFLCCTVLIGMQGVHAAVPLPQVIGPIPVTRDSHPFNAASHNNTSLDLVQLGYVEEEYFISGYANVYTFSQLGHVEGGHFMSGYAHVNDLDYASNPIVRTADVPYTTRILVRRPVNPSEFSGTVIVELLHPTAGYDLDIQWQLCHEYFISHGDAWLGITSKPVAVQGLKNFDSERYAPLSWDNPLPLSQTCPDPYAPDYCPPGDTTPATENGLVWDIMSQVGALLKQSLRTLVSNHPLHGFQVDRVFATGYAQTANFLVTYINFIRPLPTAHLNDGSAVYDGYLLGDGDALPPPLNQCDEPFEQGDERIVIQPRPEPVISVITQTTVSFNRTASRADSDLPTDRYRRYEVPGASNISQRHIDFSPSDEDKKKSTDVPLTSPLDCTQVAQYGLTDFPLEYIMNGAFANLDAWVRDPQGHTPPSADRIEGREQCPTCIALDDYDNALGGVRTPYLDVPIASYYVHSTPFVEGRGICGLMGYKVSLDCEDLLDLNCICIVGFCFSCNRYVPKVEDAVEELVQDGFITAEDGERIISEAVAIQPQLPYRRLQCTTPIPTPREPGP